MKSIPFITALLTALTISAVAAETNAPVLPAPLMPVGDDPITYNTPGGEAPGVPKLNLPITEGPFKPTWESLESQYKFPEWFRDAKFGIWAHWGFGSYGPQGFYPKNKGVSANPSATPSLKGAKDALLDFKAEHWDPVKLLTFYKENGVHYFMALANHHDNFDNWNSKYQPWNSVNMGPHRDMIAEWQTAAKKLGLRFGVSSHAARAWEWYEVSQGVDKNGVPYDGNLTKADGKGLWWEGYDPQDLYAQYHHTPGKFSWDWNPKITSTPSAAYMERFYLRHKQLYEDYHPDMVYFDDRTLPFHGITDQVGLALAADIYNANVKEKGRLDVLVNCKFLDVDQRKGMLLDFERARAHRIRPEPWQTDTCIGNWFYGLGKNQHYKSAPDVVRMLVDIVSKNGNLMLSIPLQRDGTPDDEEIGIVKGIGAWLKINGEAIFATRPWKIYGEGPSLLDTDLFTGDAGGGLLDVPNKPYTSKDIRFTQSKDGKIVYVIAMDYPKDGKLLVKTLSTASGKINEVSLLGYSGKLDWKQTVNGLIITMPEDEPYDFAYAFKILGKELEPATESQKTN